MPSTADLIRTAIRVEIARQNTSQTKVARRIGRSDAWLSTRLGGTVSMSVDDLDLIATKGLGMESGGDLIRAALAERSAA